MVSSLAIADIEALVKAGVTLTPAEIIRLNELAVKIERATDSANVCEAPRVAWVNEIPIYQPTIASEQWFYNYAQKWWKSESLFFALAFSCAHAIQQGFFDAYNSEKEARRAIVKWWHTLAATQEQMQCALAYAMRGELGDEDCESSDEKEDEECKTCQYTQIVNEALAAGLGLTVDTLRAMPATRIMDILRRWTRNQVAIGGGSKADIAKDITESAQGHYFKFLTTLQARIPNGNE